MDLHDGLDIGVYGLRPTDLHYYYYYYLTNDNLTRTTKRQNTYQRKLTIHKRCHNKQQRNKNMLKYDRQGLI